VRPIEVGTVSRTFFAVPLWLGIDRGFFADEGLEVRLSIFGNASQVEPLVSGSMHVAVASPEAVPQNAQQGGPLRFVAGNAGRLSHFFIAQPKFKRVEDLRGATIGILNMVEGTFFQLQEIMARHGMRYPADYKVVETGGAPPRHKALLEGKIDAGLQSIPWVYLEEEAGFSNLGDVADYVPDWQFTTVNVNRDWAAQNRDALVRFLRALLKSTDWVYNNRDGTAAVVQKEMGMSRAHAERGWDYYTGRGVLARDLSLNLKGLDKVIRAQIQAGLLPQDAETDAGSYVEPGYLDEARATLKTKR
jgi:ABC-type nitrate/sulfonate/bicarbonate transport system substrate-binding protein